MTTPAYAEMKRRAQALQSATPALAFHEALTQVVKADPELYRRDREEQAKGITASAPAPQPKRQTYSDPGQPVMDQLNRMASELRATRSGLTQAQAFAEVSKAHPELVRTYRNVREGYYREAYRLERGDSAATSTPMLFGARDEGRVRVFTEMRFADVPEWIPGLPKPGVYEHPDYGSVDVSIAVRDQIIRNFANRIYQSHIPIDIEHSLTTSGAAGYIRDMRVNADGSTDFKAEWTDIGRQMIGGDRVKYVSPTILPSWIDRSTNPLTPTTHSNVLIGHALTVRPWFKEGALRPLHVA